MAAPSRYSKVLSDHKWQAAFGRQNTIDEVLSYLVQHWHERQKHPPKDMLFSSSEPKITKFFCVSLRKNAERHGISGNFTPEAPLADIDEETLELHAQGRADIEYFSDATSPAINLIFEFKKMKSTKVGAQRARMDYFKSGVTRFVNAKYARDSDLGFMIGLVDTAPNQTAVLDGLKRAIQIPDMVLHLRMIKNPSGNAIDTTGLVFAHSAFETRHARDHVPRADVLLGHLLLVHET